MRFSVQHHVITNSAYNVQVYFILFIVIYVDCNIDSGFS